MDPNATARVNVTGSIRVKPGFKPGFEPGSRCPCERGEYVILRPHMQFGSLAWPDPFLMVLHKRTAVQYRKMSGQAKLAVWKMHL